MTARTLVMLIACSGWAAGCTAVSDLAKGSPVGGDCDASVAACEGYLERHPLGRRSAGVRFRLAMAYLSPESASYDVARARGHLWQLAGAARGPYEQGARRVLELIGEVERLRSEAAAKAAAFEGLIGEVERLRQQEEAARSEVAAKSAGARYVQEELQSLRGKLRDLSAENAAQQQRIERLTRELRELKRIDTQQVP